MTARGAWRGPTAAFQRRAALGLRPFTAPIAFLVPLGILLGPSGIGAISVQGLAHLDVVVTIALGTLGVFIGVEGTREQGTIRRLFAAAMLEAAITVAIVAGSVYILLGYWGAALELPALVVALALGISASASAAPGTEHGTNRQHEIAARIVDLDDVLPIVLGGIVLGAATSDPTWGLMTAALAIGVGLGVGICGWLLFERAQDLAERGVFVLGAITLLSGSAAYVDASPLLAGVAAGAFWVFAPGRADQLIARDLGKIQHPLVVLLLITAGAAMEHTLLGMWLLASYVTFRVCGKLIGGWAATRVARDIAPSDLGAHLMPAGVIGVAFALNLQQVGAEAAGPILFAVGLGAVVCEVLALALISPAPQS